MFEAQQAATPEPFATASSTSGVVFDGPSESDTHVFPPDSQIAAGPNHVVVAVNSLLAIYDKTGALQGSFQNFSSFFSSLGITGSIFDPRIIYDQADQRFILSAGEIDFTGLTNGHVLLAVSASSDPTGTWNKFAIDSMGRTPNNTGNTFPDFPGLGLSQSAVYITTNQFTLTQTCLTTDTQNCFFSDAWIKVIGLPELLSGNPNLNITAFTNVQTATGFPAFAIQPALTYGVAPAEFLVAAEFNANPSTLLNVFAIGLSGTPTLSTEDLSVPSYSLPPDAIQPQGAQIATNDFRPLNAVWSNNSLWCGQNVLKQPTNVVTARWYGITASSLASIALAQTGDITGAGDAYFPSLGVKPNGDVGMVFTTSSYSQFASAAFTGRAASDAPNSMHTFSFYRLGTSYYSDQALRWGDYNGLVPDPDGASFWMIAEYAGSPNPNFGTAIARADVPAVSLSVTTIDFGTQTLNMASALQTVSITNSGSTPVTFGSAAISGANGADFTIGSDGCSGATVAPAASCSIGVIFTPSTLGTERAALQINTNPPLFTQQIYLIGQGSTASPNLTVSPPSLDFGAVPVHTTSLPQTVNVTNTGTHSVTLLVQLNDLYSFTQTNNCGPSLAAGQTCQIKVVFHSTSTCCGTYSNVMNISYNGYPSGVVPLGVQLSGTPTDAPGVNFCPTNLQFGNQTVGTSSPSQLVTLNNSGSISLTVISIGITGNFSQTNTCGPLPATIPAGMACSMSVTFTPTTSGALTGTLTVTDNVTGSPHTVALTGTGVTSLVQLLLPQTMETQSSGVSAQEISLALQPGGQELKARAEGPQLTRLSPVRSPSPRGAPSYGKLPLAFEANSGQTDARAKFFSRGPGYKMFLMEEGAVISLERNHQRETLSSAGSGESTKPAKKSSPLREAPSVPGVVRMSFEGANLGVKIRGVEELPGTSNYFIGRDSSKSLTNVARYAKIEYDNLYPGVNLVYYGNEGQLEYDFVVTPGASTDAIHFNIAADRGVRVETKGDLVIATEAGEVRFRKPVVYQEEKSTADSSSSTVEGENRNAKLETIQSPVVTRHFLDGHFVLTAVNHVGFKVGSYDHTKPLVIDPVLTYSTYLGGSDADTANAIAVDAAGSAYIVGTTASANFPVANALQPAIGRRVFGQTDAFITKLSPDGRSLVFSTYLGGSNNEDGRAIALDAQGNVYVAGQTGSSDFPVTQGAFQTLNKNTVSFGGDGFLAKISPSGSSLVYSTYFGGAGVDIINSLAVDSSGNAYIGGATSSLDFPTTPGAIQTESVGQFGGCFPFPNVAFGCGHGFVAEVNPQGTGLIYSTYFGGNQTDYVTGIAVDSTGSAYITGATNSSDFPTTPGVFQSWLPNVSGAFVAKVKPLGAGLAYSTYLGPNRRETNNIGLGGGASANGIAVDNQGAAYVVGTTFSGEFPTVNPFQTKQIFIDGGTGWGFVTKLHPAGCALTYSTYLGGLLYSAINAVAVDFSGDAIVTGWTYDRDFPTLNGFQASYRQVPIGFASLSEAFVTELAPAGSSLIYSSYLGGTTTDLPLNHNGGDVGNAIAVDSAGNAYVVGKTDSIDFPTVSAADSTYGGKGDGFVTKVAPTIIPSLSISPASITFPDTQVGSVSAPVTATITNPTSSTVNLGTVTGYAPIFTVTSQCGATLAPGATCTLNIQFTPDQAVFRYGVITINDNAFGGPHAVTVYGNGVTAPTVTFLSGNPLNFGGAMVGTTVSSGVLVLNSGTVPLIITNVTINGGFTETTDCLRPLQFQQTCNIQVSFTPTAPGTITGVLTITDNAPGSPQQIQITGDGADFSLAAASGSLTSTTVVAGQTANYQLSFSGTLGFYGTVSASCSGAPTLASCTIAPASLSLNGTNAVSATVTVTTTSRSFSFPARRAPPPRWLPHLPLEFTVLVMLLALALAFTRRRKAWVGLAALLMILAGWASCGGGGGGGPVGPPVHNGTPAGTYTLTVTGTYGSGSTALTHTLNLTLTVQ
jgi:hypothetical protein